MIETVASWLQHSKSTVILTGAGMSTESGIPDFRSKAGWWKFIDPRTPVNQLPKMAKGKLVYINLEVDTNTQGFDAMIQGTAGVVLAEIDAYLSR